MLCVFLGSKIKFFLMSSQEEFDSRMKKYTAHKGYISGTTRLSVDPIVILTLGWIGGLIMTLLEYARLATKWRFH